MIVDLGWGDPDGERHSQVVREGDGVGFVEGADGSEALGGGGVAAQAEVVVAEGFAEVVEVLLWEAVDGGEGLPCAVLLDAEDAADVDEGVAGHDEGELGLA